MKKKITLLFCLLIMSFTLKGFNFNGSYNFLNLDNEDVQTIEISYALFANSQSNFYPFISFEKSIGGSFEKEGNYENDIWIAKAGIYTSFYKSPTVNFGLNFIGGIGEYGTVINPTESWENQEEKEEHFVMGEILLSLSYMLTDNLSFGLEGGYLVSSDIKTDYSKIDSLNGVKAGVFFSYLP